MDAIRVDRILRPHYAAAAGLVRVSLEGAVPEGHFITITAGHRAQPGTADVRLIRESDGERIAETRGRNLTYMCWYVIDQAREPGLRVTTNRDGYVVDIEEVA